MHNTHHHHEGCVCGCREQAQGAAAQVTTENNRQESRSDKGETGGGPADELGEGEACRPTGAPGGAGGGSTPGEPEGACDSGHDHGNESGAGHEATYGHDHSEAPCCTGGHEHDHEEGAECACGHDHGEHQHGHESYNHEHEDHGHGHDHTHQEHDHGSHAGGHSHGEPARLEVAAALATGAIGLPLVFRIEGLDCPDCAAKLAQVVRRQAGVVAADISYAAGELQVFVEQAFNTQRLRDVIARLGYGSKLIDGAENAGKMRIEGLDCPDCAAKLEQQLLRLPGITRANLSFSTGVLVFEPEAQQGAVAAAVERAGYRAIPILAEARDEEDSGSFWVKNRRSILTFVSGFFLVAGWGTEFFLQNALLSRVFYVLGMLSGGFYVARSGFYALMNRTLDMNFLMTVAAVGAVAIGEWHEGAMVVFLFSLGNTLQAFTMDKTRQSIRALMKLAPKEALVRRNGVETVLPVEAIELGDLVIVRPGERVAMDGIVQSGTSAVNQAPITGESIPVDKMPGERIFAGSINGNGSLEIVVDHLAADNTLSRIMHLVEEAQSKRAPSQQLVDRFAAYYTPIVMLLAVAMAIVPPLLGYDFAAWFKKALIMLVVSCPCALVISTPVSIVSAIGNASRNGVLIKGGAYLEAMGKVRTIAFDKTGTLTKGEVRLAELLPLACDEEALLLAAAALELRSEHPLAKAIVEAAEERGLELPAVQDFQALTGSGATALVEGHRFWIGSERLLEQIGLTISDTVEEAVVRLQNTGHTVVFLLDEKRIYGLLALADVVRPEAAPAARELRAGGIESLVMLTGDNSRTAAAIGEQLDIDQVRAELLPADKVAAILALTESHGSVAMVGDGVNDAPALAAATVGVALGVAGTDTAIETADIALMADDLTKLPWLMRLSRKTVGIIGQNIVLSLAIKGVVLVLTFMGRAELWMGVLADTGAALLVIANGMRLMRTK